MFKQAKRIARSFVPQSILERRFERYFFSASRKGLMHLGRFSSLPDAKALLAARGSTGRYAIDQERWAEERMKVCYAHDYPMLHWLGEVVADGQRLVDLGGSVGVTYYLFRSRLALPRDLVWQVSELSEVVELGVRIKAKLNAPQLAFTDDWRAMDGATILLCAGALQYFDLTLAEMLDQLAYKPRHLLINRVPMVEGMQTFFTLQNTGESVAPMRVEAISSFLADMAHRGYELVDQWKCLENEMEIAFHPECTLTHFRGFYLRLNDHAFADQYAASPTRRADTAEASQSA